MQRFLKSNILNANLLLLLSVVVEPSQTRKAGFAGKYEKLTYILG